MFGWKLHPNPPPTPRLSPNPDASQEASQMMTHPLEMLKATHIGYLSCAPENRHVVFRTSFPVSSLGLESHPGALIH